MSNSANREIKLRAYDSLNEDQKKDIVKLRRGSNENHKLINPLLDETKVFNDPVHGHISLPLILCSVIDTPEFQRLRKIKQLGGVYYVFPGASHNRFEHSIGVAYLAGRMCRVLQKQQPELRIREKDRLCIQIAGLCHDLGHGPLSHFFDGIFIPRINPESKWKHEEASVSIFEHLVQTNDLMETFKSAGLDNTDLVFIKELIYGPLDDNEGSEWSYRGRPKEKEYLYQIVANKVTGIDVDKWDYFARDCYHLGISNNFDYRRFMKFARVVKVDGKYQICTRDKEVSTLYDMFHTRSSLHRVAYQHKTKTIIEAMFCDAFIKANELLLFPGKNNKLVRMSDCIHDMHAYQHLTDDVISMIDASCDERLKEAKDLIKRIQKRDLYKMVGQTILPDNINKRDANALREDILKHAVEFDMDPEDFVVDLVFGSAIKNDASSTFPCCGFCYCVWQKGFWKKIISFNYGMKDQNPIDKVRFYEKKHPNNAIMLKKRQISQMLPEVFAEQHLRIYYKHYDENTFQLAKSAFQEWCCRMKFKKSSIEHNPELTPVKQLF